MPETRPERLLPPAACAITRAERGVCFTCGEREDECAARMRESLSRLDELLDFFGLVSSKEVA